MKCLYAGSFDPITNGHIDVITRAGDIFDEVTILIANNPQKKYLFSISERYELIKNLFGGDPGIKIETHHGLLVDYAKDHDIPVLIRGLRAISDFEVELQMAQMNRHLGNVETFFIPTTTENSFLSSSAVKEIAKFSNDAFTINKFVPINVAEALIKKSGWNLKQ